jgi:hypothetical protein
MAKKDNSIIIVLALAGLGYGGYLLYNQYMDKKKGDQPKPPSPEPTPSPTPTTPVVTPKAPNRASASKINQLQQAMIQWYNGKAIKNITYTDADATGGWGRLSRTALQNLYPVIYANNGDITASNIDLYINLLTKDLEKRASEQKQMQSKQATDSELKKLSANLVKQNQAGNLLKVLTDFTAIKHKFDSARGIYLPLGESRTFKKGQTIRKVVDRKNGQILIVDPFNDDFRFPTNPNNLYVA